MKANLGAPGARAAAVTALAALAILGPTACGPPDDFRGVPAPQSVVPGTAGRECYYVNTREATPGFADLARPETRGNVALWGRGLEPADSVELSVRWADDGKLLWVRAIRSTLERGRVESLETLLMRSVVDTARPDWGVRVWIVGGDVADVAPSVICPPRPRQFAGQMPRIMERQTLVGLERLAGRRFPVEVRIDGQGNVLGMKLLRQTGFYTVDQYLMEYVWRSSFWPKLHDGIGLSSTLEINIEIPRRWW